jgi:hypothetical protein
MSDARSPYDRARRAVEVVCFAPIGVACYLADLAPSLVTMLVGRGQGEVARRQEQVGEAFRHVRTRGEALVAFGLPALPTRHQTAPTPSTPSGATDLASAGNGTNGSHRSGDGLSLISRERGDREAAGQLPIPGYDSLSASQVVERLAGLDADDLEAVRRYEAEHRNRRTIIGKIEQLA